MNQLTNTELAIGLIVVLSIGDNSTDGKWIGCFRIGGFVVYILTIKMLNYLFG